MAKRKRVRRKKSGYSLARFKNAARKRAYSKKYLRLMNEVKARDLWTCQMCFATNVRLQIHHIMMHSKFKAIRENKRNLISLCKKCHESIRNREEQFAPLLKKRVATNTRRYRKEKIDHDKFIAYVKEHNKLPDGYVDFEYKKECDLLRKKGDEDYLRKTWRGIKYRTTNKNSKSYKRYGGRGIKMCDEWLKDFHKFKDYVLENLGDRGEGQSLDRINNDGNYEPGNIRWASAAVQRQNNSEAFLDAAKAESIFILFHKYKMKQYQIMDKFALNTPTIVSNVVNGKTWTNRTSKYIGLVRNERTKERLRNGNSS